MKSWIIGDSFSTPTECTDVFDNYNKDIYHNKLPNSDLVLGSEWVKQVVTDLGYEYNKSLNLSLRGCSNDYILHNIDWVLNNDDFEKEKDLLVIVPTLSNRFMYKAEWAVNDDSEGNVFKFTDRRTPHLNFFATQTNIPAIDEYGTLYRDQEFEYYRAVSSYDKLIGYLKLFNIDYLFCSGIWNYADPDNMKGYKPQFIDYNFPGYDYGMQADLDYMKNLVPDMRASETRAHNMADHTYLFPIGDCYSNHMTHIGHKAYAEAVLKYIKE